MTVREDQRLVGGTRRDGDALPADAGGLDVAPKAWTPRAIATVVALSSITASGILDRSLVANNLELIRRDIHVSDSMMGLVVSLTYAVAGAACGLAVGRLSDFFSRRAIIAAGYAVYTMATAGISFAGSALTLGLGRTVQGGGEATGISPAQSLLGDLFPPHRRRGAMAVWRTITNFMVIGMLPITGYVAREYGWRASFYVLMIPSVFIACIFLFVVRDPPRPDGKVDPAHRFSVGDVLTQCWRTMRGSRVFLLVFIAMSLQAASYNADSTWGATFLMRLRGFDPFEVASLLASVRLPAAIIGGLGSGLLCDYLIRRDVRWRFWFPAAIPIAMTFFGAFYLLVDVKSVWLPMYVIQETIRMGLFVSATVLALETAGPGRRATGLALVSFANTLMGEMLGPTVVGVLNDTAFASTGQEAIRFSLFTTHGFAVLGGLCFLAAWRADKAEKRKAAATSAGANIMSLEKTASSPPKRTHTNEPTPGWLLPSTIVLTLLASMIGAYGLLTMKPKPAPVGRSPAPGHATAAPPGATQPAPTAK